EGAVAAEQVADAVAEPHHRPPGEHRPVDGLEPQQVLAGRQALGARRLDRHLPVVGPGPRLALAHDDEHVGVGELVGAPRQLGAVAGAADDAGGDPLDQDARRTHRGSVPPCRRAPATCGHAASSVTSPATSHRRDRTRSARTPVRRLAATTPSTMSATTAAHGRPRMATATVGAGPRRTIDRDTSGMRGGLRNVGARRPWARAASARERARRAKRRDVGSIAGPHRRRLRQPCPAAPGPPTRPGASGRTTRAMPAQGSPGGRRRRPTLVALDGTGDGAAREVTGPAPDDGDGAERTDAAGTDAGATAATVDAERMSDVDEWGRSQHMRDLLAVLY